MKMTKLKLTCIGKDKRPKLEARIWREDAISLLINEEYCPHGHS